MDVDLSPEFKAERNVVLIKKAGIVLDSRQSLGNNLGRLLIQNVELHKTGLLVDWLSIVELEMATLDKSSLQVKITKYLLFMYMALQSMNVKNENLFLYSIFDISLLYNYLQMELLFSKKHLPSRPLLISIVLQRASWSTLFNIVTYLLSSAVNDKCPTSALDFLCALTKSPKLWQGRDKAVPKHHTPEDILQLNTEQVQKSIF